MQRAHIKSWVAHKLVSDPFFRLLSWFEKMACFSHSICISTIHGMDMSNLYNSLNRCMLQHIWYDHQNDICDIFNSVSQVQKIHYNTVHMSYTQCEGNIITDVTELGLEGIKRTNLIQDKIQTALLQTLWRFLEYSHNSKFLSLLNNYQLMAIHPHWISG